MHSFAESKGNRKRGEAKRLGIKKKGNSLMMIQILNVKFKKQNKLRSDVIVRS